MPTVELDEFKRLQAAYYDVKQERDELRVILEEVRLQLEQAREFRQDVSAKG